jgi:4'-phosphopantetheinyl transferase
MEGNGVRVTSVRAWRIELRQPPAAVARAAALLAPDERERAARFHFERDRERFVLARGALREILAGCVGAEPAALRFVYSAAGKPALAPGLAAGTPLSFNLSHSHQLALLAVTSGAAIGADVEHARDLPDLVSMARRFFAPGESRRLLALPREAQAAAFYRCWTRKEAYLKARGEGLPGGLDRFEVAFGLDERPALLATHDAPAEAAHWSMLDLDLGPGYAAAIAVRATNTQMVVENFG